MARKISYDTSDVFTKQAFTGNQLAILHVHNNLNLSHKEKQQIAIEFNYSESVFLHHPAPNDPVATYKVEIFTPESEIPFAGHPTIGTASFIFENLEQERNEISIILKAGRVKATFDRVTAMASAEIPHDVRVHAKTLPWDKVVLSQPGLSSDKFKDTCIPVVSVVNGQGLLADLFYVKKPAQGDGVVRVQQRMIGIGLEDAATGAASAALSAYLALLDGQDGHRYVFELEQGVQMGRRSIIGCEVVLKGDGKSIWPG